MRRPRVTIGAAILVIAAFAVAFAVFRVPSERRAVEFATQQFLKDEPGSTSAQIRVGSSRWDSKKRRWVIAMSRQACFCSYYVDSMGFCGFLYCVCG